LHLLSHLLLHLHVLLHPLSRLLSHLLLHLHVQTAPHRAGPRHTATALAASYTCGLCNSQLCGAD
jgi:hypothetical protein